MARGRTVTALVADVVNSTELFGRLGVDQADIARRALFGVFDDVIETSHGVLIKTMGDGCLASFDAAADAIGAAVTIQQAVASLAARKVEGLTLRVGVAVGDVTEEADGDIFGPAVVVASRLCAAAADSEVLTSDLVRMLAGDRGGHEFQSVGGLVLKGIAEPVPSFRVRFEIGDRGLPLPLPLALTPLEHVVGREAESQVLDLAIGAAWVGQRRAVFVAGEPGIGKTRLVAAAARRAHRDGALVLFGRCEEDLSVAYQPFTEALQSGLGAIDPGVVADHVGHSGGELRRLVPDLEGPEPVRAEPELEQARLFDAVADLLERIAEQHRVVVVLDDLHWATASTIALLRHLLHADPHAQWCVLGTYRDTEVDRSHPLGALLADIPRVEGLERIGLGGLDGRGVEDLVMAASGDDLNDDTRALAAALADRTAGNPFFANQVLRHLVERGALVQQDGRWAPTGPIDDFDLPVGVLDAVGRRLAVLSPATDRVMSVAAVSGLEFNVRILQEVAEAGTPDEVVDGIDEAVHARLLVEKAPGRVAFAHAIVRSALLREHSSAKRARLHRATGEATLAVYGDSAGLPLAELARHFTEAAVLGDAAWSARWSLAAASASRAQADHRGAITVLRRSLDVIENLAPVDQVARFDVAAAITERHLDLFETDEVAVASARDAAELLGSGERMLRLIVSLKGRGAGVSDLEGLAMCDEALELLEPDAVPLRALAISCRAMLKAMQGIAGFPADAEVAAQLIPEVDRASPRTGAMVRQRLVFATLGLPDPGKRLRYCDEGLNISDDAADPWSGRLGSDQDLTGRFQVVRAHSLLGLGRRADYEACITEVTDLGRATGELIPTAMGQAARALLALADGRFDEAADCAQRMLATSPTDENLQMSYFAILAQVATARGRIVELLPAWDAARELSPKLPALHAGVGLARLENGDRPGAHRSLEHLVSNWDRWARDWVWPYALVSTAELVVGLGLPDPGDTIADELLSYSGELVVVGAGIVCTGAYDRYRGMLADLDGRHDDAIEALSAALDLEESIQAPALTARTRYWLAHALLARDEPGDGERAADELRRSIRIADDLGMAGLLRDGEQLGAFVIG